MATVPQRPAPDPIDPPLAALPQSGAPAFLWLLVGILGGIELVLTAADAGLIGSTDWRDIALVYGAFWKPLLSGEVTSVYPGQTALMFLTHAFLHGGMLHFAMNAVILLSLGKVIAARVGAFRTLAIFALSAVAGGAVFGLLSQASGPMIGASGAVFGFLGTWNAWELMTRRRRKLPLRPILGTIFALVLANVALFVFLDGGLAWEAHLGGYVMGWIAGLTFSGRRPSRS